MLPHERGDLGGDPADRLGEVAVEVEVQGRVEEDRLEAGAARRLLRLGPPAGPLRLEAQAGDDAHHRPAPVAEVEERAGAADRLVVGVRCDVEDRRSHHGAGYAGVRVAKPRGRTAISQNTLYRLL